MRGLLELLEKFLTTPPVFDSLISMASRDKGKGKAKADSQSKPEVRPEQVSQPESEFQQDPEDRQVQAAIRASLQDSHGSSRDSGSHPSRPGPSQASSSVSKGLGLSSTASGGRPSTQSRISPSADISQAVHDLAITDARTTRNTVPCTVPPNTGSISISVSTDTQSSVPTVNIREAARIDLDVPQQPAHPPSSTRQSLRQRQPETIYEPAHDSSADFEATCALQDLSDKLDYPVRASLRLDQGRNQRVVTNHFELIVDKNTTFYEYQIVVFPEKEKRSVRKRLMTTALDDVAFLRNLKADFASDYFDTIISWVALHDSAPGPKTHEHDPAIPGSYEEWQLVDVVDRGETISLSLRLKGIVDLDGFRSFTKSTHAHPATFNPKRTRKALHIIMSKCIQQHNIFHLNSNKFFVENAFQDLHGKDASGHCDDISTLRAIRGYHYKIKPGMGKILLNVTSVTSAFWNPKLVSEVLRDGLNAVDNKSSSLKGLQVHIEYERGKAGRVAKNGKTNENGQAVHGNNNDQGNEDEDDTSEGSSINDQHSRIKRIRGFGEAVNTQTFEYTPKDNDGKPIGPSRQISVADYLWEGESSVHCNQIFH